MKRRSINVCDYANDITKALSEGVLLTTKAEQVNTMVIGWGTLGINWNLPVFAAYVRGSRFTASQLEKNPQFTVNIPIGESDKRIIAICGSKSGRDTDKIKEAGLTLVEGEAVDVPAIREFPLTLECRVLYAQKQDLSALDAELRTAFYPEPSAGMKPAAGSDAHITYFGEIVNAYILED